MKKTSNSLPALPRNYQQLQRRLRAIGLTTQSSIFQRRSGQQSSRYVWTRKLQAKSISVALSKEQLLMAARAAADQRELDRIIAQMQKLSRQIVFETAAASAVANS